MLEMLGDRREGGVWAAGLDSCLCSFTFLVVTTGFLGSDLLEVVLCLSLNCLEGTKCLPFHYTQD